MKAASMLIRGSWLAVFVRRSAAANKATVRTQPTRATGRLKKPSGMCIVAGERNTASPFSAGTWRQRPALGAQPAQGQVAQTDLIPMALGDLFGKPLSHVRIGVTPAAAALPNQV